MEACAPATSGALDRTPPQLELLLSRALQALSTPIVALLITTGDLLSDQTPDAISFCNVLFVGNLCGALVVLVSFGPRRIAQRFRSLDRRGRLALLGFGGLSTLLSALLFTGLRSTSVTNAVLMARLGPVLFAVASCALAGRALKRAEWVGFTLVALGAGATFVVSSGEATRTGDLLILASTVVYAVVMVLSRWLLARIDIAAVVFARNFLSAIVFFAIANALFGPGHFADVASGPLWGIMLVYALVVIVAAQLLMYRALGRLSPASIARWSALTPLLGFVYALGINGERAEPYQLAALALVVVGTLASNLEVKAGSQTSNGPESSLGAS